MQGGRTVTMTRDLSAFPYRGDAPSGLQCQQEPSQRPGRMKRLTVVFSIVAVWIGHSLGVLAETWPKLHNGKTLAPCAQAL